MTPEVFAPPVVGSAVSVAAPQQRRKQGEVWTRLLALLGLCGFVLVVARSGIAVTRLVTDSYVAPIILTKDSDAVLQSKLNLSRLLAERRAMTVRLEESRLAIDAAEHASQQLIELRGANVRALDFALALSSHQTNTGDRDLVTLDAQEQVIGTMIADQEDLVSQLREQLSAGTIHKVDLMKEEVALKQLRVLALDNERHRIANQLQRESSTLTQSSLRRPNARGIPTTPEVIAHQDQLVKLNLELLRLDAEVGSKRAQRAADELQASKLDELVEEMKLRPIFRAIESSQHVAFVPYTQIDGVTTGSGVFACKLWGFFLCRRVGRVAEVVPGEVVATDPWGAPMRGQYAILELAEPRAAEQQSLRVRPSE